MPRRPERSDTDVVGVRAVAQLVDLVVIFLVVSVFVAVRTVLVPLAGGVGGPALTDGSASLGGLLAVGLGYCWLLEAYWNGQTVGKRLVGIRVVMDTGTPVGPGAVLMRNVPVVVSYGLVGYLVALVSMASSDRRQRLFDSVARTVVVTTEFDASAASSQQAEPDAGG